MFTREVLVKPVVVYNKALYVIEVQTKLFGLTMSKKYVRYTNYRETYDLLKYMDLATYQPTEKDAEKLATNYLKWQADQDARTKANKEHLAKGAKKVN